MAASQICEKAKADSALEPLVYRFSACPHLIRETPQDELKNTDRCRHGITENEDRPSEEEGGDVLGAPEA